MISESNAHRDVARILKGLLGETRKGDESVCVKGYIAELNCLYPTKYAKLGGSQSLSLVDVRQRKRDQGAMRSAASCGTRDTKKYRDVFNLVGHSRVAIWFSPDAVSRPR